MCTRRWVRYMCWLLWLLGLGFQCHSNETLSSLRQKIISGLNQTQEYIQIHANDKLVSNPNPKTFWGKLWHLGQCSLCSVPAVHDMGLQASTPAGDVVCFCLPWDHSLRSLCSVPAVHDMAPQAFSTPAESVCFCLPQDSSLHSLCSVPAMHDMGLQASTPAEDGSYSLFLFTLRSQPAFSLFSLGRWHGYTAYQRFASCLCVQEYVVCVEGSVLVCSPLPDKRFHAYVVF